MDSEEMDNNVLEIVLAYSEEAMYGDWEDRESNARANDWKSGDKNSRDWSYGNNAKRRDWSYN